MSREEENKAVVRNSVYVKKLSGTCKKMHLLDRRGFLAITKKTLQEDTEFYH